MSAWYRLRQFWQAAEAELGLWRPPEIGLELNEAERALFSAMSRTDQRHALAVWQYLQDHGPTDPILLKAALLHDVGKANTSITLWHRGAAVLLKGLGPKVRQKAVGHPNKWSHALYENARHPERGAQLLRAAGMAESVVKLVYHHHACLKDIREPELRRRVARLQKADNVC